MRPREDRYDPMLAFEEEVTGGYCTCCWMPVDDVGVCLPECPLLVVRINGEGKVVTREHSDRTDGGPAGRG